MSSALEIPVHLELGPPLHDLPIDDIAAAIHDELAGLIDELGLLGDAVVSIAESDIGRPVRIRVRGRVLRYTPHALWRAWIEADAGSAAEGPDDQLGRGFPAEWLRSLRRRDPAEFAGRAAPALGTLVRELVARTPGALVGAGQEAAYLARLPHDPGLSPDVLGEVLARLLDAGVLISEHEVILETLEVELAAGRTVDDVVEGILRRLRSDVVELHVHPAFAPELLGGVGLTSPLSALDPALDDELRAPFEAARDEIERDSGIPSPDPVWVASERVPVGYMAIRVNQSLGPPTRLPGAAELAADATSRDLERLGLVATAAAPALQRTLSRLPAEAGPDLSLADIGWWRGSQLAASLFVKEVYERPGRLFTIAETEQQLVQLSRYYAELVDDVMERFDLPELTRILRELLAARGSIRNLRNVLQRLLVVDEVAIDSPADWMLLDDLLAAPPAPQGVSPRWVAYAAHVRSALGADLLTQRLPSGPVAVVPIEPRLEGAERTDDEDDALLDVVWRSRRDPMLRWVRPVVATDLGSRRWLQGLVAGELPDVMVCSWRELPGRRAVIDLSEEDGPMIALESVTRSRVHEMLAEDFGEVKEADDGSVVVRHEDVPVVVAISRHADLVFVELWSLSNRAVPPSADLYRWVALSANRQPFGRVYLAEAQDGMTVDVVISHNLLGNYLDRAELLVAIAGVCAHVREGGPAIHELFGGEPTVEPAAGPAGVAEVPDGGGPST